MRTSTLRLSARVLGPAAIVTLAAAWGCGGSSPAAPSSSSTTPVTLPSLDSMLADKVMGSDLAPITMLEYSSLTCSHCADFHATTLPLIKSTYIDTGKVRVVYRDFPLDTGAALSASMVARCSGDRFFTFVDLLFRSQGTWAGSSNTASALKSVVATAGMSAMEVDTCLALSDLRAGILTIKSKGQNDYGVSATPTFIINGQQVVGAWPYSTFDAIFKGLL